MNVQSRSRSVNVPFRRHRVVPRVTIRLVHITAHAQKGINCREEIFVLVSFKTIIIRFFFYQGLPLQLL